MFSPSDRLLARKLEAPSASSWSALWGASPRLNVAKLVKRWSLERAIRVAPESIPSKLAILSFSDGRWSAESYSLVHRLAPRGENPTCKKIGDAAGTKMTEDQCSKTLQGLQAASKAGQ